MPLINRRELEEKNSEIERIRIASEGQEEAEIVNRMVDNIFLTIAETRQKIADYVIACIEQHKPEQTKLFSNPIFSGSSEVRPENHGTKTVSVRCLKNRI